MWSTIQINRIVYINSIPAPELFLNDKPKIEMYIQGARELENFSASFISIACNTAHLFYEELQNSVSIPIIDLRKEVKAFIKELEPKSIVLFGSSLAIKQNLYSLNKRSMRLSNEEIKKLDRAIFDFNRGEKEKAKQTVLDLANKYSSNSTIIAACTEISEMLKDSEIDFINTMDVLAEATLKYYKA